MVTLFKKFYAENDYSGSDWNYEKTTKYVFKVNEQYYIEAGFFIHYLKRNNTLKEKKCVIELSSSYGCPMRCGFCAASQLSRIYNLQAEEIYDIFSCIFMSENLYEKDNIVVSILGTGDLYFTFNEVENVILKIHKKYPRITISVSSCRLTGEMVNQLDNMSDIVNFRAVQLTHISCDSDKLGRVIEYFADHPYDFEETINSIQKSHLSGLRINYILIEGINDSEQDFNQFIKRYDQIKERIVVRISRINTTEASKVNNITSPDMNRMQYFKAVLNKAGFKAYLFYSYKNDNMNCGQLIMEKADRN